MKLFILIITIVIIIIINIFHVKGYPIDYLNDCKNWCTGICDGQHCRTLKPKPTTEPYDPTYADFFCRCPNGFCIGYRCIPFTTTTTESSTTTTPLPTTAPKRTSKLFTKSIPTSFPLTTIMKKTSKLFTKSIPTSFPPTTTTTAAVTCEDMCPSAVCDDNDCPSWNELGHSPRPITTPAGNVTCEQVCNTALCETNYCFDWNRIKSGNVACEDLCPYKLCEDNECTIWNRLGYDSSSRTRPPPTTPTDNNNDCEDWCPGKCVDNHCFTTNPPEPNPPRTDPPITYVTCKDLCPPEVCDDNKCRRWNDLGGQGSVRSLPPPTRRYA